MSLLFLILVVDMASREVAPAAVALDLDRIAGDYQQPASRCPVSAANGVESCAQNATDRMIIQKISDEHARIVLHSHQAGGHQCHLDGVANLTPMGLQYCLQYEPGTCVTLTQDTSSIKLKVTLDGDFHVPFCGSRATLDGLTFRKRSRLSLQPCQRHP